MNDHAVWAHDYRMLYLYAMRMARAAHRRAHMNAVREWKHDACIFLAKRHQHIMAQDKPVKGPLI